MNMCIPKIDLLWCQVARGCYENKKGGDGQGDLVAVSFIPAECFGAFTPLIFTHLLSFVIRTVYFIKVAC